MDFVKAPRARAAWPTTSWTRIQRAVAEPATASGRKDREALFRDYWLPVYAYIRRHSRSADDAYDRTQGFFAHLHENNRLARADEARGKRFRAWLLTCAKNYLTNLREHERAARRAPRRPIVSLDAAGAEGRLQRETAHTLTPELLYHRQFALSVLAKVTAQLEARYEADGHGARFHALRSCLPRGGPERPYGAIAAELGITVETARRAALDLRRRFTRLLHQEVLSLVDHPEDVHAELRELDALLAE